MNEATPSTATQKVKALVISGLHLGSALLIPGGAIAAAKTHRRNRATGRTPSSQLTLN